MDFSFFQVIYSKSVREFFQSIEIVRGAYCQFVFCLPIYPLDGCLFTFNNSFLTFQQVTIQLAGNECCKSVSFLLLVFYKIAILFCHVCIIACCVINLIFFVFFVSNVLELKRHCSPAKKHVTVVCRHKPRNCSPLHIPLKNVS